MNNNYIKELNGYKLKDSRIESTDFLEYSTTEKDTGMKWIDGRPIYRKVLIISNLEMATLSTSAGGDNVLTPGLTHIASGITNMDFLINCHGAIYDNNQLSPAMFPLTYTFYNEGIRKTINGDELDLTSVHTFYVWWWVYSKENNTLDIRTLNTSTNKDYRGYAVLEYVKTTD